MIQQSEVNRYVKVKALEAKYKKEATALRDGLVEQLAAGVPCPTKGPFLLKREVIEKPAYSWKDMCEALAEKFKATKILKAMKAEAGMRDEEHLEIEPNPMWGKKKGKS